MLLGVVIFDHPMSDFNIQIMECIHNKNIGLVNEVLKLYSI